MTSIFTDYGYWDGKINPEPEVSVAAYRLWSNLAGARECLERAAAHAEAAHRAQAEKWDEVKAAARDCELALAAVIAKLCREPELKPITTRPVGVEDRVIKLGKIGGEAA